MSWLKRIQRSADEYVEAQPEPPTPGRPPGSVGDTGIRFSAWYGAASNTLIHATRDDDPRCMKVLCAEARVAGGLAKETAVNERQSQAAEILLDAVEAVFEIAEHTPPLIIPHSHDPLA